MKKVMIVMLCLGLAGFVSAGQIKWQRWDGNTTGAEVGDQLAAVLAFISNPPTIDSTLPDFHMPDQPADNFNALLTGWVKPQVSGMYKFWVSGDDDVLVWKSPNAKEADKVLIAQVNGWTDDMAWDNGMAYPSGFMPLYAGKSYFLQALMGDGTGGGHCAVGWEGPGISRAVIATQYLSDVMPTDWMSLVNEVAINPSPADGAVDVAFPDVTLSWELSSTIDPTPPAAVSTYKVYFGTDPDPNELNQEFKADVNPATPELAVTGLSSGTTYYWRVDTLLADSNMAYGTVWSFTTKVVKPVVTTQPVTTKIGPNCTGTFTIVALSGADDTGGPMTYAWKKVGDATVLGTETSYTTGVAGVYYCEVTNSSGTTKSNEAEMKIMEHGAALKPLAIGDSEGVAGTGVTISGDQVTVSGSGTDIWNAADDFQYAYVDLTGNFDVSVRVTSLTTNNTDGWTKAGIMVRGNVNTDGASPYGLVAATSGNGISWQGRNVAGTLGNQSGITYATPIYLRLTRNGDIFNGYYSTNGIDWTIMAGSGEIAQDYTMALTDPVYVGLAVTAHAAGSLATAVFDNLSGFGTSWQVTDGDFNPKTPEGWANPAVDTTFSWTKAQYGPCGATYKVYGSENGTDFALIGQTTDEQFTVPAGSLIEFNKTYFWRVDTHSGEDMEEGMVWTFDSVKQLPVIRSGPAPVTVVDAGATANLNIVATTSTVPEFIPMVKYEWFHGATKVFEGFPVDDGAGNYSCPLAVENVQLAKEGEYTCVVTNTVGPSTSAVGVLLTHRLMIHYTFDSVSGNTIPDSSASGFNGTLVSPIVDGTPVYGGLVNGMINKAIQLVGPNDPNGAYIATGKTAVQLGVLGALPRSFSIWAKTQLFNDAGLYDMGAFADSADFSLRTLTGTTQRWRVQYWGGADRDLDIVPSFNNWVHTVLVNDGANNQLYINGKLALAWAGAINTSNNTALMLGNWGGNRFVGQLDDFRLYNYALTPKEAASLYAAVSGTTFCAVIPTYDLDGDCEVDMRDFAIFAAQWAKSGVVNP